MTSLELLQQLIANRSFSGQEEQTADIIFNYLLQKKVSPFRFKNNVWAKCYHYNPELPTLLLNSHHDTVQPSPAYTKNPFLPIIESDKIYGLGSNDAGASVVSLIAAFCNLYRTPLKYNLILAITAEEEAICKNGISALWPHLGKIDCALVGEPTQMEVAIAERGLLVLDVSVEGVSGHAARNEGLNAIYKAMKVVDWFSSYQFDRISKLMGSVKMTVTQINAGTQHNVVPASCSLVVDIRPTDCYTNVELVAIIQDQLQTLAKCTPRSTLLNASAINNNHPLVARAVSLGMKCYISPTTSDISRIHVPAIKMGPGDSARSHTADEFVYINELETAPQIYIDYLLDLDLV